MRLHLPVLFIFCCTIGFGQGERYRFSVGGGFHTMMYWGLRDLKDVKSYLSNDFFQFYAEETYDVNYDNFQFVPMYKCNFNIVWFSREKFEIEQSFSFYSGPFEDRLETTLKNHSGVPSGEPFYPDSTVQLSDILTGVQATHYANDKLGGVSISLLLRKKLAHNFYFGLGMGYSYFGAHDDRWRKSSGYSVMPSLGRGSVVYTTKQLTIQSEISYRIRFISLYVKLGQTWLTTKKSDDKGHWAWNYDGNTKIPVSHNFDFRFPLTFESGISVSFDRIKKCNCPEFD